MEWHGMAWDGMGWHGMVWDGMGWYVGSSSNCRLREKWRELALDIMKAKGPRPTCQG